MGFHHHIPVMAKTVAMAEPSNDDKRTKVAAERRDAKDRCSEQRRTMAASRLEEGMIVFHQGELGDQAYIVKSGKIEIFATVGDQETILGTLEVGALFGEMALIDNSERTASAPTAP